MTSPERNGDKRITLKRAHGVLCLKSHCWLASPEKLALGHGRGEQRFAHQILVILAGAICLFMTRSSTKAFGRIPKPLGKMRRSLPMRLGSPISRTTPTCLTHLEFVVIRCKCWLSCPPSIWMLCVCALKLKIVHHRPKSLCISQMPFAKLRP